MAKMATAGATTLRFRMALQKPMGDVTEITAMFYTLHASDRPDVEES